MLVGHFISIDLSFLNREMKRLKGAAIPNPRSTRSASMNGSGNGTNPATVLHRPARDTGSTTSFKCFDIPVNGAHNAIMDAFTTAQLFQRFFPMLLETNVREIGDLVEIGMPFEGGDRFGSSGEFSNF